MGIHNDVVLVYGIEFAFDQVKHITDLKEVLEESESDNVLDIWSEFDLEYACAYGYDRQEEDCLYFLGEQIKSDLTLEEFIKSIDKEKVIAEIKKDCERFKLQYEEPRIIFRPHTC
jgi:hypothetical protein